MEAEADRKNAPLSGEECNELKIVWEYIDLAARKMKHQAIGEAWFAEMIATHGTVKAWVADENRKFRLQVLDNPQTYLWAFESMDDLLAYAQG